ncbi:MAG: ferredoxin [Acidimicrobiaceae bacterium]|nr:ferredoxin [Acidimicrobiaceae bacterium]MYC42505.1 ferredoxin [Acidimicrobiaceae bacterium]MYH87681.1 ferredoxin [Acidimicrobiaceae bacterium]
MKILVDRERCTGHGRCYTLAPDVYEPDDDGYCQEQVAPLPLALVERARIGAANCPEDAITVIDD